MKKKVITFKIEGKWTVDEMSIFLKSVEKLYNAFFAIEIKRQEVEERSKFLYHEIENAYYYWRKYTDRPILEEFLYLLKKIIRDYPKKGKPHTPILVPWFHLFLLPETIESFKINTVEIFQHIDVYIDPEQRLYIKRIQMGSPGFISFEGVGKIMEQIREFIKDVWYRNRQEKEKGEIELKTKKLEYAEKIKKFLERNASEYNESTAPIFEPENEFVRIVINSISSIEKLEKQGKLKNVTDKINYKAEDNNCG